MNELSTERIFRASLEANDKTDELCLKIQWVGEVPDTRIDAWEDHFGQTFFALARAGGLGGTAYAPRIRDPLYDSKRRVADNGVGTLFEWYIPDLQVAPEALRVLVNLVESAMYRFEDHAVFSLAIAYGKTALAIETLGFPEVWPDCPFEVEEYPIESNDFDIELALAEIPRPELARRLSEHLSAWWLTVQRGGFGGDPYAQWKPGVERNEKLVSLAGQSLILHIQQFYAQPAALASLRNLLIAAVQEELTIEALIIGE